MTLLTPVRIGSLRGYAIEAGMQRLDGGAMFGVVPKPLWERRFSADDRNRIGLAMRVLLLEHPAGLLLIDTGLGNKEDDKFRDIYGVANEASPGPTQLENGMREAGYTPDDVQWVLNTHLHFDHAGGNTTMDTPAGDPRLTFPRATYVVQRRELEFARHTNERTRASYLAPNFEPVARADRWRLLEGNEEILPGIRARITPGHVPWHQSIVITDGGDTLVYLADVMPTTAHFPLPWIMGYDLEPMRTLETKRALVDDAAQGGWRFLFEHDPNVVEARVTREGGRPRLVAEVMAPTAGATR